MHKSGTLSLFYEEPDVDRWVKFDRYPRKIIRNIIRGREPIGGVKKWFLNLVQGLDMLNLNYTVNDYKSLKNGSVQWALVIGKPHVVKKIPDHVNIIYGPGVSSHPLDDDFWLDKSNIKHIILSCEWMKDMYDRDLPADIATSIWPSGIETELWTPNKKKKFNNRILIYDKIRWEYEQYKKELLDPIYKALREKGIQIDYIKYGDYREEQFRSLLSEVDGMIFLCEHETQGFAYLQTLSCDVPILAWDRGGYWQDPSLYPDKVKFAPVTSVPYWDGRCGEKFTDSQNIDEALLTFWYRVENGNYSPRSYILENFKLEDRSLAYKHLIDNIITKSKNKLSVLL